MFSFLKKSATDKKAEVAAETPAAPSWRERLFKGLAKTRAQWGGKLKTIFSRGKVDDELLEELETLLLTSDCGIEATQHLLDELKKAAKRDKLDTPEAIQKALHDALLETLSPLEKPLDISTHKPFVIMIAGVNGAGKTTSIGKLAKYFQTQGKTVLLAAGDTFRAAAREQLETWGERNNVTVIAQDNGDPAAVVFDAISAAKARGIDIVLADTAGRLPTQLHLMEEIAKVRRVIQKIDPEGPHETLLVLDANIGQNALQQVKAFDKAIKVTGLVLTKLDGTAKGGVVTAIARQCPKPIRFIGVGEQIDDLRPFSARDFVDAMIVASNLSKRYPGGFEAVKDVSFQIEAGQMVLITGHSGAGKTTLVKLMSTIEKPTSGSLVVNGQNLSAMRRSAIPHVRRHFGLVFQNQKLLFDRNALDNVLLPLQIAGLPRREAIRRAQAALDKVGLLLREKANPIALSGGEQQRLAIARAVVNRPTVLLADEPTGNLDVESGAEILEIFADFHRVGVTVVVATHDQSWIERYHPNVLRLDHGRLL